MAMMALKFFKVLGSNAFDFEYADCDVVHDRRDRGQEVSRQELEVMVHVRPKTLFSLWHLWPLLGLKLTSPYFFGSKTSANLL